MTSNPLAGSRPGQELAAHIGAYSTSKAIKAGWDALRALIAARPEQAAVLAELRDGDHG